MLTRRFWRSAATLYGQGAEPSAVLHSAQTSHSKHRSKEEATQLAKSEGRWTDDYPITVQALAHLEFKVFTDMPRTV